MEGGLGERTNEGEIQAVQSAGPGIAATHSMRGGIKRGRGRGGWVGCERARSSLNLAENGHLDLIKRHLTS